MKITRDRRGRANLTFSLNDDSFDEWMKEAEKSGANLFGAALKVAKKHGVKAKVVDCLCDDDE